MYSIYYSTYIACLYVILYMKCNSNTSYRQTETRYCHYCVARKPQASIRRPRRFIEYLPLCQTVDVSTNGSGHSWQDMRLWQISFRHLCKLLTLMFCYVNGATSIYKVHTFSRRACADWDGGNWGFSRFRSALSFEDVLIIINFFIDMNLLHKWCIPWASYKLYYTITVLYRNYIKVPLIITLY